MSDGWETPLAVVLTIIGLANLVVALFFLPQSPGFDERTLYAAVYAYQHYGRLFYPIYDTPFMYIHPPTKYWLVGILVSSGISVRLATAGLLIVAYLTAVAGAFACRFTFFQRLAVLFALSTTVTLCPFVAYAPENLTHGEIIGRIRPEDLVLVFWLAGLLWLEASRTDGWRASYAFLGAALVTLACVTHYFGAPAVAAIAVYAGAALVDPGPHRLRRLAPLALGGVVVGVPFLVAVAPYLTQMFHLVVGQGGETSARGLASVWSRHLADFWFLLQWMKRHAGNVWAALALLAAPVRLGIPPLFLGAALLLMFRSSRVLALAAASVPIAVLFVAHKWIGYELPEVALFFLGCSWALATLLERLTKPWIRRVAAGAFMIPLLTASPLVWDASALQFMDDTHAPELLRAMSRAIVGPGATVINSFYTGGEDNFVYDAHPEDRGVDFVAEREFNLDAAHVHDLYEAGRLHLAGFVFTPSHPSASTVFFATAQPSRAVEGFIVRGGQIQKFSPARTGWRLNMLECQATADELPWVSPTPPIPIAGYVPRVDYCVNQQLARRGLEGRYASMFLRRTFPNGTVGQRALVPLLIDDGSDSQGGTGVAEQCSCRTIERIAGGLAPVSRESLLRDLKATDRVIRFYSTTADLLAGRTMPQQFFGDRYK